LEVTSTRQFAEIIDNHAKTSDHLPFEPRTSWHALDHKSAPPQITILPRFVPPFQPRGGGGIMTNVVISTIEADFAQASPSLHDNLSKVTIRTATLSRSQVKCPA